MKRNTIKRLLSYMKHYKFSLSVVFICIILSSLIGAVSSLFIQVLIDDYIYLLLVEAVPNFSGLFRILMIMASIYGVGVLANLIYNRTMVKIAQGVLKKIRDELFSHMQSLPISYFDTHAHGDIMSHYTNDIDTLRQMLTQSIPHAFSSLITIAAVFGAMMYLSIGLSLFVLAFVFIILKLVKKIAKSSGKYFMKQQQSIGSINGYIEEMIKGQKVVKVFCHEDKIKQDFDIKNEELCENSTSAHKYANILMPIMNNLGYILYVLIALVGGTMAVLGFSNLSLTGLKPLTLGMIASFLQLSRSFINPIAQISQQMNSVVMALAGAKRVFDLMDEESEVDDGYVTLINVKEDEAELIETSDRTQRWAWKHPHSDGSITYTELKGEVHFYDVDFGYTQDKMVLHDITMYAKQGQKLALVGATGAGKTTITNLINRFYDIADGKIRYDGININKIKKADLRKSLGIVLQDVNLFTGSVMENIRYGRLDATDEECINSAKLANADGFIRMLPNGYDTVLSGDGNDLSQGQRQLISIARAAVANPPVMILDEATSSIDTRTESIVQQGMDSLMHGRTVFVIAHRLSTIQNSKVIMVMEDGKVIERGSHEELIKQAGKYYQLYTGAYELE